MSFIIHNVGVVRGARRVLWRVAVGILVASMLFVAGLGILPASADPGDAVSDSSFSLDPANTIARAIWSDGTTMWVVDLSGRLFAYTLATGARDTGAEITTLKNKGNKNANGMWSDGTTIWVSDDNDDKIYAYDLASGVYRSNKQIAPLHSNNDHGKGLWSDGTTIWVADHDDDKLYGGRSRSTTSCMPMTWPPAGAGRVRTSTICGKRAMAGRQVCGLTARRCGL